MPTLKIEGVSPAVDGEYDFDLNTFTNRELHTIKQISGVRGGEILEAAAAADNDLIVAFAVIALARAGKNVPADAIWDADVGKITVDPDAGEADDERPPASPPVSGSESKPAAGSEESEPTPLSGEASRNGGDPPANRPNLTGLPGSDTTSPSDQATLAS